MVFEIASGRPVNGSIVHQAEVENVVSPEVAVWTQAVQEGASVQADSLGHRVVLAWRWDRLSQQRFTAYSSHEISFFFIVLSKKHF